MNDHERPHGPTSDVLGGRYSGAEYLIEDTYRETRLPVQHATTLIAEAYRSETFFGVEQRQVFARSWVVVGHATDVRDVGQVHVSQVAGQSVIVTRDREGRLRGFYNVCRHRGTQLVADDCQLTRFRCPYHSWAYGLDGELLGTPLFEDSGIPEDQQATFDTSDVRDFDRADYGLLPVRVDIWGGLLFVNLHARAGGLREWLGDLPERLAGYRLEEAEPVVEQHYAVSANWKLVGENFMEYYHLPWVHPELVKVSRMQDHHRFQGPGGYTGMCTTPVTRDTESGWSSLPEVPGLSANDAVSGRFIWLFPNVALAVLPAHVFTVVVTPRSATRCTERTAIAVRPEAAAGDGASAALRRLAAFWDRVNREDIAIVERVQRGITTVAYTGGRMCYRFEEPVHRFQNMLIDKMVGLDRVPPGDPQDAPVPAAPSRIG